MGQTHSCGFPVTEMGTAWMAEAEGSLQKEGKLQKRRNKTLFLALGVS